MVTQAKANFTKIFEETAEADAEKARLAADKVVAEQAEAAAEAEKVANQSSLIEIGALKEAIEEVKAGPAPKKRKPRAKKAVTEDASAKMLNLLLEERKDMSNMLAGLAETVSMLAESVKRIENLKFEIPTPIVNVTMPTQKKTQNVIRDDQGNIERIEESIEEQE